MLPGGGNVFLTMDREDYDVARWLAARGVAAFSAGAGVTMGARLTTMPRAGLTFLDRFTGTYGQIPQVLPSDAAPTFAAVASDDPVAQASTLKTLFGVESGWRSDRIARLRVGRSWLGNEKTR